MSYITDKDGQVKCINVKGDIKWLPKHIAENTKRMKSLELSIVEAPKLLEPIIKEEIEVAESVPAKGGRKQKQ